MCSCGVLRQNFKTEHESDGYVWNQIYLGEPLKRKIPDLVSVVSVHLWAMRLSQKDFNFFCCEGAWEIFI